MIEINTLVGWMLSVVLTLSQSKHPTTPAEDAIERLVRMESISKDIIDVVFDPAEEPLFPGPRGREKSAVFVATYASHESGRFNKNVDLGKARGDGGSSWCIMQLHIGAGKTAEGWTGKELIADRQKCVRAGYHVMRSAMKMCKGPEEHKMAAYISGRCDVARTQSQERYKHAMRLFKGNSLAAYSKGREATIAAVER